MKYYIGVTDNKWFKYLANIEPEDLNFWQPSGTVNFKAIPLGAPFLFKLKKPLNAIGGVGFFVGHSFLPLSIAWETFGERNGCHSYEELRNMIYSYREDSQINPKIGCIVLTDPIFFDKTDWIETPTDFASSIVQGKSYNSNDNNTGQNLWRKIELLILKYKAEIVNNKDIASVFSPLVVEEPLGKYGNPILIKPRIGQGAFRVMVIDAYNRKCAISNEKTLPVLQAAHIKPYSEDGPHSLRNGILLRSDIHTLFDNGYMTITPKYIIEVSNRIKEEFDNGKEYYKYQGNNLLNIPIEVQNRPSEQYLEWHNLNVYKG